ncbi:KATNB1-like protein 1 [Osmerus eperlanus]|uniref:KATNB1-like protein 1 n=1 Tax=Osmerus eperlanus TaxID=29151 RepID=UPI002E0FC056
MATGNQDGQKRKFDRLSQAMPHAPCMPNLLSVTEETMKKVDYYNKEDIDKDRFTLTHVHIPGKVKRVSVCKRKARQAVLSSVVLRRVPRAGLACDMANKENELISEDIEGDVHYNDNCGFPVNSAEASKMTEPGSKCGDYFAELSKDHEAMTHVLFGRNLRLNVALTLWRRNTSELVAYLIRIQDTGVLLDCLPVITKNLQSDTPCISLGCCVDLLPQVKTILASKHEEHLIVGLHWVQSVIKKWWPELSANGITLKDSFSEDKNLQAMRQQLKECWEDGTQLSSVPGTTGEMAKTIESYLSQLH